MDVRWQIASTGAGLLAAFAANRAMQAGWKAAVGHTPPDDPEGLDNSLREAILFAVISGALIAVLRVLAVRGAAKLYYKGGIPKT